MTAPRTVTRFAIAAGAAAALAGAGAGATAATSAAATQTKLPSCSRSAIQSGLARGTEKAKGRVRQYGCAGGWAYAAVVTKEFEFTALLQAHDGRWQTVNRSKACRTGGPVPAKIHRPACETN